jgi:hypothetical protein
MKKKTASRPRDLVDVGERQAAPIPKQRKQLATLLGALLREIAAVLAAREAAALSRRTP